MVTALAAIEAKSDSGTEISKHIVDVTRKGTKCTTFTKCADLLKAGTDIDYDGISGPIEFSPKGDPTQATINVSHVRPGQQAAAPRSPTSPASSRADRPARGGPGRPAGPSRVSGVGRAARPPGVPR